MKISGDGDTNAGNNMDTGSLTVICSAIRINKDSTKGGPVLVAGATFTISPHPNGTGAFTVVDNGTNDADSAIGEICVTPVAPGVLYTITETVAPVGLRVAGGCDRDDYSRGRRHLRKWGRHGHLRRPAARGHSGPVPEPSPG